MAPTTTPGSCALVAPGVLGASLPVDAGGLRARRSGSAASSSSRIAASASARRRDFDLRAAWLRRRVAALRASVSARRLRAPACAWRSRGLCCPGRGRRASSREVAVEVCSSSLATLALEVLGAGRGAGARAAHARRASPAISWPGRSSTVGHQLRVDALDQHAAEPVALGQHHLVDDEGRGAGGLGQLLRACRRRRGTRRSRGRT